MAKNERDAINSMTTGQLLRDIADDTRVLIQKEVEAARIEIREEVVHVKRALILGGFALAGALVATIALMFAFAHLLRIYTPLTEWSAFAVVALVFAALALIAALVATREGREVHIVPRRTLHEARRDAKLIQRDVRS